MCPIGATRRRSTIWWPVTFLRSSREPTPVLPLLRDGRVRALAVSSTTRLGPRPTFPPLAEAGVPGFDFVSWQLIVAPAGTPKDIVGQAARAN